MLDCAVRKSLMPPDINHGDALGLMYTVQNKCIIFLVSLNGAEFYAESKTPVPAHQTL